jgi:hypothetical protein
MRLVIVGGSKHADQSSHTLELTGEYVSGRFQPVRQRQGGIDGGELCIDRRRIERALNGGVQQ